MEVDCAGNHFHEQLVTERPGHADQQVGGYAAHHPVHINRTGKKCLLKGHDDEYGHAKHFEGTVPAPRDERRVEFDDQVRREFQNGQRENEIHQHALGHGRDCTGEKHEREREVDCDSPWARLADHRNENSHKHQECEEEAQVPILAPETRQPPIYFSHVILSFRIQLADFVRGMR